MAILQNVPGTWGVGRFKIPDFGITEMLRMWAGKTPSAEVTTRYNNPNVIREAIGSTAPYIPPKETKQPIQQPIGRQQPIGGQTQPPRTSGQPQPAQSFNQPSGDAGGRGDAPDYYEEMRRAVESTYGSIFSQLDQMAGLLPSQQAEDIARLEQSVATGRSGLETAKTGSLANLDIARRGVEQEVAKSTADITNQLRNLLSASQQRLGLMGAGSSSAAEIMLPWALGKQAAQAGSQVAQGALTQLNAIEMKKNDVQTTYDLAVNQLEQDKTAKLQEIVDKYRSIKSQIDNARNVALERKMQLNLGLLQSLQGEVDRINDMYTQYSLGVRQWALDRIAQLDNYKIQLGQMGKYDPQALTYRELRGIGDLVGVGGQPALEFNPYLALKKRDELLQQIGR